jgi:hypothetical protein
VEPHETPTRLTDVGKWGPVALTALPWLVLAALAVGAGLFVWAPLVPLVTHDRWGALGVRLGLALCTGIPFLVMTVPGVIYGHSVPRFLLLVARHAGGPPRLAVWRRVGAAAPVAPPRAAGPGAGTDPWGAEREDWT